MARGNRVKGEGGKEKKAGGGGQWAVGIIKGIKNYPQISQITQTKKQSAINSPTAR